MRLRSIAILVLLVLMAVFTALNWTLISQNANLNLGVMQVQGPLGVVLLAFSLILILAFVFYVLYMQSGMLLDSRRQAKEMEQQRHLADQAELSRFTELRSYMQGELMAAQQSQAEQQAALLARLDRLEANLAVHTEQLLQK